MVCCAFSLFHSCAFLLLSLLMLQVHLVVDSMAMNDINGLYKHVWSKVDCTWHE